MKKHILNKNRLKQALALTSASLIVLTSLFSPLHPLLSEASNPTQVVSFPQSLSSSQSKTITIPDLVRVESITSNTGNATYTVNGEDVTINVTGGTPSGTQYNATKYSKTVTDSKTSSSNSFASTASYTDADGYSGTLSKEGVASVISGTYSPADSATATESLTSSTNSFPATVSYNSGGYSGTLSKSGSAIAQVVSGSYTPSDTIFVTNQTSSYYNSGGYSGTLSQYVYSGSYTPADTKFVTNQTSSYYNVGGYSGNLSPYVYSGTYTPSDSKFVNYSDSSSTNNFPTSVPYSDSSGYTGTLTRGTVSNDSYTLNKYVTKTLSGYSDDYYSCQSGKWVNTKIVNSDLGPTYYYSDSSGYSGTLSRTGENLNITNQGAPTGSCTTGQTYVNHRTHEAYYAGTVYKTVSQYSTMYSGTVTKPAVDTRVYRYEGDVTKPAVDTRIYRYQGYVTKPSVDTRVYSYTQNYSGTVYKPESDTRTWQQNYSGTVYKSGYDNLYSYEVSVNYVVDDIPPVPAVLSADKTTPTNGNVVVTAIYPNDASIKQVKVNNGNWMDYTAPVTFTDNGYVEARGIDEAGNISAVTRYDVNNIDKVAPNAPVATSSKTIATNQDVTVAVIFSGDSVVKQVRKDNGAWVDYTSPVVFSANGKLEARSYDNAGNVSAVETLEVTNIDKLKPNVATFTADQTAPTNKDVTVTVAFPTDVVKKEVRVNDGGWTVYTSPILFSANGYVEARGTDHAGNVSELSSYQVSNIDKVAPVNPTHTAQNNANIFMLSGEEDSTLFYQLDDGSWTKYTEKIVTSDGTHKLSFKAIDPAGNESEVVSATELMYRDALQEAVSKVVFAESNITQSNVDVAYEKVDLVPHDAREYQPLIDRLDDLQAVLNAKVALEEALKSRNQADVEDAKVKIDILDKTNPVIIDLLDDIQSEYEKVDILALVAKERYDILSTRYQMSKEAYNSLLYSYFAIKYTGDNMYKFASEKIVLVPSTDKYYELAHEQYNNLNIDYNQYVEDRIATDAEIKAESSVKVMESKYDPTLAVHTQGLINAVEDATVRASLQQRLDTAKAKYEASLLDKATQDATASVEKAESTKQTYYVSEAYKKVNALINETLKADLTKRLQALEAQMAYDRQLADAKRSVDLAEQYKYDSYITSAQTKVSALPDGADKTALQERLNTLKVGLPTVDQAKIITNAKNALSLAQSLKTQYYVDKAQTAINLVEDATIKAELQAKLDAVVVK